MNVTTVNDNWTAELFPLRKSDSNKGTYGTLVIIGGSERYAGAPYLASLGASALRAGCGIVRLAVPRFLLPALQSRVTECTLYPLECADGHILPDADVITKATDKAAAVICGMGIGDFADTAKTVKILLGAVTCPLLFDADALNAISKDTSVLDGHRQDVVLTPHIGEMSRLCGKDIPYIKQNKISVATEFAAKHSVTVLLKDNVSVITDGTEVFVNTAGTPAMAKGGSGDLLAGIAGGLMARKIKPLYAAAAAAYIAGKAAERAARNLNEYSLLPSETARVVADVVTDIIKGK